MKTLFGIAALLLLTTPARAADDSKVTFIGHDAVAKGGALVSAPDLIVMMVRRTAAGQVGSTTRRPTRSTCSTARPRS